MYSLGVTLHALLGGEVDADGHLFDIPALLPAPLARLLARALDPQPARRPTATTIATVLDELPHAAGFFRAQRRRDESGTWPADADQRKTCDDRPDLVRRAG